LTGADIKGTNAIGTTKGVNGTITGADIAGQKALSNGQPFVDGSLNTYDIQDRGLRAVDLATDSLTTSELGPNSVSTSEIKDGSVTNAKLAPLGAWSPLTLNTCGEDGDFNNVNWGNAGTPLAARLDAYGVDHLRGAVSCFADILSNPPTIATLPAAYRPKTKEVFPVASSDGSGNYVGGATVVVDTNGSVTAGGGYDRRFISLSGIEFDTLN
jgi:hypothetical protein